MPSSMPRITWIEIQGFRAFGKKPHRVELTSSISVFWGPNSQGKTSFAEAIEFLFTGAIVRKELLAGGHDEFADSLRNTHLPQLLPVYIAAEILDNLSTPHLVRRTLASDFGKKTNCTSMLEIDGKPAGVEDLARIGVRLSQPPMAVPILMQHTLGYLFTAKPSERSLYFKALLDIGDLDILRNTIGQRQIALEKADTVAIKKLKKAAAMGNDDVRNCLEPLLNPDRTLPNLDSSIADALCALILTAGFAAPLDDAARIEVLSQLLHEKQATTFPLAQLNRRAFVATTAEPNALWDSLEKFGEQSQKLDAEIKQLTNLFTEVLKVPAIVDNTSAIDCPVCGTDDALTPERVRVIRNQLETSRAFLQSQESAKGSLRQLATKMAAIEEGVRASRPNFRNLPRKQRKEIGVSTGRMRALLPVEHKDRTNAWMHELRRFLRATNRLLKVALEIKEKAESDPETFADKNEAHRLRQFLADLKHEETRAIECEQTYSKAEQSLNEALRPVVDANSNTIGWQELIEIAKDKEALCTDLIDMKARATVIGELTKALQKIDRAKEEVMNQKFAGMSQEIQDWWERLRPEEPVFFSGVKPRPQTVRTIDFKASLAADAERLNPHIRDVIAIFSTSQMHCLGLAAFLARSIREKCGFVIMDDPILSSDEDHRTNFVHGALEALIDANFQIILLTQDQNLRKDISYLYSHFDPDLFDITMTTPVDGCDVTKASDSIKVMLARAGPFVGNANLEIRKLACEKLRDIAERVCKEIIVNNLRQNGDATVSITDYAGSKGTLESLIKEAAQYLTDPSHNGKLRVIAQRLNPGNHDDAVPTKGAIRQAYGDLQSFRKEYDLS